jgi:multidrug efflux pump subunit AcrA (membrane-fusion protein)
MTLAPMGIGLDALRWLLRSRSARWTAAATALLVVLLASTAAYALTGDEPKPAAQAATTRTDRGEVALAVATRGALRPAQDRSLGFGTSGAVTEVNVRPGDQVQSGQVLALIDDADAQDRVNSGQQALDQAKADLVTAEQSAQAASGSGCGGAGGGTAQIQPAAATATRWTDPALSSLTPSPAPSAPAVSGRTASPPTTSGTVTPTPTPSTPTPTPTPSTATATPTRSTATPTRPTAAPTPSPTRSPSRSGPTGGGSGTGSSGTGPSCPGGAGQSGGAGGGTDAILRAQQKVTSAELTVAEAEEALVGTKITAPIAGKVLTVAGAVGSDVNGGDTFITLGDIAGMEVSASFPEADAGRLVTGLAATVTLPDRPGQEFAAKVSQVDPVGTANGQMVTFGVVLDFTQMPENALVGQSAGVRITIQSKENVLRVPSSAVHGAAEAAGTILVPTAAGTEQRQVVIGVRGDQYTEISSGLAEGDVVVTNW